MSAEARQEYPLGSPVLHCLTLAGSLLGPVIRQADGAQPSCHFESPESPGMRNLVYNSVNSKIMQILLQTKKHKTITPTKSSAALCVLCGKIYPFASIKNSPPTPLLLRRLFLLPLFEWIYLYCAYRLH